MLCKSSQLTEIPSLGFCLLVLCPVVGFHSYSVFRPTRHSTLAPCSSTDDAASRASGRSYLAQGHVDIVTGGGNRSHNFWVSDWFFSPRRGGFLKVILDVEMGPEKADFSFFFLSPRRWFLLMCHFQVILTGLTSMITSLVIVHILWLIACHAVSIPR